MKQYAYPVTNAPPMLFAGGDTPNPCDSPYEQLRFTLEQLCEHLHDQVWDVEERYGQRIHAVIMGSEEAQQLFQVNVEQPYRVNVPVEHGYVNPYYMRIMGLAIHHLPWMRGMVVVPELMEYVSVPNTVNQWSLCTGQHQIVGVGPQAVNVERSLPEETIKAMLGNFKTAFVNWAERPSKKSFLREPSWWKRLLC